MLTAQKKKARLTIFFFLVVPVVLLITFSYYPCICLVRYSFTNWNGYAPTSKFVGLKNYINLFTSGDFSVIFRNMLIHSVMILGLQTILALYQSVIFSSNLRGRKIFFSLLFLPYVFNDVAVSLIFGYMYSYTTSPVNILLNSMGLGQYAVRFISLSWTTNIWISFVHLWKYTGLCMILFYSALKSVPTELYEASALDGATTVQQLRYITLPSTKSVVILNLFLTLNGAIQLFSEPQLITQGGPGNTTQTLATYVYQLAFTHSKFGKASAVGVLLVVILFIVWIAKSIVIKKEVE